MSEDNLSIFVQRLKLLIWEFKSCRLFEEAIGVTPRATTNWLQYRCFPRGDTIIAICRTRNVSADWLLGLSDDPGRELVMWGRE